MSEEAAPVAAEAIEHSLEARIEEPAPAEEMLNPQQAAVLLGVTDGAIYWLINKRLLPATRGKDRRYSIPRSAVEARLAEMQSPEFRRHPRRSLEKVRVLDAEALGVAVPKAAPAPPLRELLKRHNDATVLYMTLHTGWQTAVREEAELRQQVLAAEGEMHEASLALSAGLAKLKGPQEAER